VTLFDDPVPGPTGFPCRYRAGHRCSHPGCDPLRPLAPEPPLVEPVARRTDPATSWAAAESVSERTIRKTQQEVLDILARRGPSTDEEIAESAFRRDSQQSPSGLRTRRRELVDVGLVVDTGTRRPTKAGRMSIVWRLAE